MRRFIAGIVAYRPNTACPAKGPPLRICPPPAIDPTRPPPRPCTPGARPHGQRRQQPQQPSVGLEPRLQQDEFAIEIWSKPAGVDRLLPRSGRAHCFQEVANLKLEAVAIEGKRLRRREHLR